MNSGHMNFFKINECGLYKVGKPKAHGCEITESLDLITKWLEETPFPETIPWDSAKKNTSRTKCYCQDIYKDDATGDFVLVLWKSDTDSAGTLWGARSAEKGKVVKYTSTYKGDDVIWGRPCYYWIIPSLNTVISIKFDTSVCDSAMLQDWITSAITNKVKHTNRVKHTTDTGFVRLSLTDSPDDQLYKFSYRFDISLRSLNTASVELAELQQKITHIIKRETVTVSTKDERDGWVKMFDALPYLGTKPEAKKRRIEIKAEAKPTKNELEKIIETYASERTQGEWDRVGFELQDKSITWVDKYRLKEYITLPSDSPDILPASYLYDVLSKSRERYMLPIQRSDGADLAEAGTRI